VTIRLRLSISATREHPRRQSLAPLSNYFSLFCSLVIQRIGRSLRDCLKEGRPRSLASLKYLTQLRISAETRPISFFFVFLVRYRAFDHQNKWREFTCDRVTKKPDEFISVFICKKWIMEIYFGNPGKGAKNKVLNAWLRRRRDRNRISITPKTGRHPKDVNLRDRDRISLSDPAPGRDWFHLFLGACNGIAYES
jgi:hypothetical protein